MTPEFQARVYELFNICKDLSPEEWAILLAVEPPDVRAEVLRLLEYHTPGGENIIDSPLVETRQFLRHVLGGDPVFRVGDELLSRFRIREYLGFGGMGEVYEALDALTGEIVAVKTLRSHLLQSPMYREMFQREVREARKIDHNNVCRIYDVFQTPTRHGIEAPFFSMELLRGGTLYERLVQNGPFAENDAIAIVRQICSGLAAAHHAGVLHRDLKSANVMLAAQDESPPRIVIVDLGLARDVHPSPPTVASLEEPFLPGTSDYFAAELLLGMPPSLATDIFALGVLIFELVTGHYPFESPVPMVSIAMRLRMPPASPHKWAPELSLRWKRSILACLSNEPSRRPSSVDNVWRLLDPDSRPLLPVLAPFLASPHSRRVFLWGGVATAVLSAGTVTGIIIYSRAPATILVQGFEAKTGHKPIAGAAANLMAESLSQSRHIKVTTAWKAGTSASTSSSDASVSQSHARFAVSARILPATGNAYTLVPRWRPAGVHRWTELESYEFTLQDLAPALDKAAVQIRRALGEPEDQIEAHAAPLDPPDTLSPEAYESYASALRCNSTGEGKVALDLIEIALRFDPSFALAHVVRAGIYSARRDDENGFLAMQSAWNLRDKVGELTRQNIYALYLSVCGDEEGSLYRKRVLTEMAPRNSRLERNLAQAYSRLNRMDDAIHHARSAVQLDKDSAYSRMMLSGVLAQAGKVTEAMDALKAWPREMLQTSSAYYDLSEGFALLMNSEIDNSLAAFKRQKSNPEYRTVVEHYLSTGLLMGGRLAEARELIETGIAAAVAEKDHQTEDLRRYWLAQLALIEGRVAEARQQAGTLADRKAWPPSHFALRAAAEIAFAAGDSVILERAELKLRTIAAAYPSTRVNAIALQAKGLAGLHRGDKQALSYLRESYSRWPDLSTTASLANALFQTGLPHQAAPLFEEIALQQGTAIRFDYVLLWITALAMSARSFSVAKNCDRARISLNRFLQLWGRNDSIDLVRNTLHDCQSCRS
jgi:serine/threonine protein kinase/Tfp pilus assembly protein PilF